FELLEMLACHTSPLIVATVINGQRKREKIVWRTPFRPGLNPAKRAYSHCYERGRANMPMNEQYAHTEPTRAEVDDLQGLTLLEFGTPWCGHCRTAQPLLAEALADRQDIRHLKIEDGPGRPLGRSFRVKLWPTLILLRQGEELARLVRPTNTAVIQEALDQAAGKKDANMA